jgi:hypothetical protein
MQSSSTLLTFLDDFFITYESIGSIKVSPASKTLTRGLCIKSYLFLLEEGPIFVAYRRKGLVSVSSAEAAEGGPPSGLDKISFVK